MPYIELFVLFIATVGSSVLGNVRLILTVKGQGYTKYIVIKNKQS